MIHWKKTSLQTLHREQEEKRRRESAVENALCEVDAGMDARLAALENALCELDARLNGGENG